MQIRAKKTPMSARRYNNKWLRNNNAMMLTKTTAWLSAFAIAMSAAAMHYLMAIGNPKYASDISQRYRQDSGPAILPPLQPSYSPPAPTEATQSQEGTLSSDLKARETLDLIDIWEKLRGSFGLPETMTESVAWHLVNFRRQA